jgi:Flp pilus assembly protein CpaB
MERRRDALLLAAAGAFALLAGGATYSFAQNLRAEAVPAAEALVALADIRPGSILTEDLVEMRRVPEAVLPNERLALEDAAMGQVAVERILAGEVVARSRLSGGPNSVFSAQIPSGQWAVVLPAGWLASPLPPISQGDHLEVLAYLPGQPEEETSLLLSAVEVLRVEGAQESVGGLTLALSLEEAEGLLYARSNGFVLLALLRPFGG